MAVSLRVREGHDWDEAAEVEAVGGGVEADVDRPFFLRKDIAETFVSALSEKAAFFQDFVYGFHLENSGRPNLNRGGYYAFLAVFFKKIYACQ
jgi:hypothetical protein